MRERLTCSQVSPRFLDQTLCVHGVFAGVQIGDHEVRPFAREGYGHGAADAGIASGDGRLLTLQAAVAAIAGLAVVRPGVDLSDRSGH